jgi:hypothetical protein
MVLVAIANGEDRSQRPENASLTLERVLPMALMLASAEESRSQ